MNKIELEIIKTITLYGDNKINIALTKNIKSQYRTKHINIQFYYIRKFVDEDKLTIKQIPSSKMLANKITKALPSEIFKKY